MFVTLCNGLVSLVHILKTNNHAIIGKKNNKNKIDRGQNKNKELFRRMYFSSYSANSDCNKACVVNISAMYF